MRVIDNTTNLKVVAISGTYVVTLGYNLKEEFCDGLLGFSIHRVDHNENESYYLEGMKCFTLTDPGLPSGSLYSTKDHPIQGFQWADYSAKPGYKYTYTVTALKGTPDALIPFAKVSIEINTENPDALKHDVYFNRGTAASQEYMRRFGNKAPDDVVPSSAAFDWLSRGLFEAMKLFVTSCEPGKHSLRIAAYEFNYRGFLEILKTASDNGVDIQIVYDARKDSPREENEAMIEEIGISNICTPRSEGKSYISHNKFMVKLENEKPICVWTGGTNFSDGGIFGHSNVAHVIQDEELAKSYLSYWEDLVKDPTTAVVKDETEKITNIPSNPPPFGTSPIFSPRTNLDALTYYGDMALSAKEGLFMTFAFGLNDIFKDVFRNATAPFRLALLEKPTRPYKNTEEDQKKKAIDEKEIQDLRNMPENVFAIGNFIRTGEFDGWLKERLTGLNVNVRYIHNKFMLIDPLSEDPIVITGSANFSNASTIDNDENMVVIRGNKRVADIYFGEFMRLFSHYSFRESLNWRKSAEPPKPLATDDSWWKDNFGVTPRSSRRKYFAQVEE
jgi:phosphatidylserine/phosphatidylglycerophosphate/cardiolipin synthase-like enzyme